MRLRINLIEFDEDDGSNAPSARTAESRQPRVDLRRRDGHRLTLTAGLEDDIRELGRLPQADDPS